MNYLKLIEEKIKDFDTIILHRHIIPDGDAYGSQLGLYHLIRENFPNKKVYAVGEDIKYLNFIGKMDRDVDDSSYNNALVFVTDCANVERIDDQRFSKAKYIIKIDHHPDITPFGDLSWVDTTFTSASEMVGYLALQLNWKINPIAGRTIYHGIVTDSIRFGIDATTPRTLQVASKLLETGFDLPELYNTMYEQSFDNLLLQSELTKNAVVNDKVGYIILTDELIKKYKLPYEENGKFANLLKNIANIDIWITFAIREDKKYRVEFRSKKLAINDLAVKWGGGGHKLASGAIINNLKQAEEIIQDAKKIIQENE